MGELDGKVAFITGAGSGMGRACAEVFVREGAKVLCVDVSGAEAETAESLGDAASDFNCDITDESQVEAAFAAAVERYGKVDAVLNVAGIAGSSPLAELDMDHFDKITNVNLRGLTLCLKHGLATMISSGGGAIVNFSSTGGLNASPYPVSAYSTSKAGVIAMTKAAAVEYGTKGVRANAICPGFVETAMSGGPGAAERHPQVVQGSALKRGGKPEEVAEVAAFLCSDRASFLTGAIVPVDGGVSCTLA